MSLRFQVLYSLREHVRASVGELTPAQIQELLAAAREYVYSGQASRDLTDPKAAVRHVILDLMADPDSETPPSTDDILAALQQALENPPAPRPEPEPVELEPVEPPTAEVTPEAPLAELVPAPQPAPVEPKPAEEPPPASGPE